MEYRHLFSSFNRSEESSCQWGSCAPRDHSEHQVPSLVLPVHPWVTGTICKVEDGSPSGQGPNQWREQESLQEACPASAYIISAYIPLMKT